VEHAFGSQFTVGIEEELLLVDPETHLLTPIAAQVLAAMGAPEATASHEAYAAQIELRSPPSRDAAEAGDALRSARAAARAAGATLMGVGLHPADTDGDSEIVDSERYHRVARMMRGLFARTPEAALHVHVGMPDPQTAIRAFNGLRSHLPLLQALSANSPWWFGRDSGLASARYALVRTYPGRGVPAAFPDFDAYVQATEQTLAAGGIDEYTLLWWDVRPHPKLGTVELREMDAQTSVEDAAALGATRSRCPPSAPRATDSTRRSSTAARSPRSARWPGRPSSASGHRSGSSALTLPSTGSSASSRPGAGRAGSAPHTSAAGCARPSTSWSGRRATRRPGNPPPKQNSPHMTLCRMVLPRGAAAAASPQSRHPQPCRRPAPSSR